VVGFDEDDETKTQHATIAKEWCQKQGIEFVWMKDEQRILKIFEEESTG
jgi:hypothetical protein